MMYVGYPKLTQEERLRASHPISTKTCCAPADTLLAGLPPDAKLKSLRLSMVAEQPRLFASIGNKKILGIDAQSGIAVAITDEMSARSAVSAFAPDAVVERMELIEEDAWTHSKALDPHRPLFRASLQHHELATLYVSSVTGEVVRDVSIVENFWNWIGAWLHWLYPFRGGILDTLWTEIIVYSSLIGTIASIVGIAIGIMRWRQKRYPSGSFSPYRNAFMRWHHVIGLLSGFFVIAWVASGLFSVNPWKIFDSGAIKPIERSIDSVLLSKNLDAATALRCFAKDGIEISELEWVRFDNRIHVLARNSTNQVWVLRDSGSCEITTGYTETEIRDEGLRLMPHAKPASIQLQHDYDWHYYARAPHTMTGSFGKPLPVLLMKFDDPHQTWLYIDLKTSRVIQRIDNYSRVKRWLFSFLHSWDWKVLLDHRPIWDVLLISFSIAGFIVSITAMVLSWKRLSR